MDSFDVLRKEWASYHDIIIIEHVKFISDYDIDTKKYYEYYNKYRTFNKTTQWIYDGEKQKFLEDMIEIQLRNFPKMLKGKLFTRRKRQLILKELL